MKFKGFGDWIEIFKGGKQIDSSGREHDGDAIIDKAVSTFNAEVHEPPIVIGHPKDNAPAFGWVEGIKATVKDGVKYLLMKSRQVVPEFEDMVKDGLFKKRSASFYPDGRLRHVGFLGAAPPAVKGLADLSFSDDDDAISFDFYDPGMGAVARILRNMRDWLIEKEGKAKADEIIPDWEVEYIREEADKPETETGVEPSFTAKEGDEMTFKEFMEIFKFWKEVEKNPDVQIPAVGAAGRFSEADLEKLKKDAVKAAEERKDAEFAEKRRKDAKSARDKEISDWISQRVKDGKLLPSWVDMGLVSFAQGLDGEERIQFAEGDDRKSPSRWFRDFLEGFGESAIFKEMATKQSAGGTAEFAEAKQHQELGESIAAKVN